MLKRVTGWLAAATLGAGLISTGVRAADAPAKPDKPAETEQMVDNPAYKTWSSYKVGTTVSLESNAAVAGQKIKTEMTQKLIELTPAKAVVEVLTKLNYPGAPAPQPAKMELQAKVKKSEAVTPGQLPPGMKGKVTDKGTEKVELAGKSYDAKVYEFTSDQAGTKMTGKTWISDKIPGSLLKMETSGTAGGQDVKMTMAVTKVETK